MKKWMKRLIFPSVILSGIGAINWGLIGLANLNLVNTFLGKIPFLESLIYVLVGVSGIVILLSLFKK